MKCQSLFSDKNIFKMLSNEFFPSMLSVKYMYGPEVGEDNPCEEVGIKF